MQRLGGKGEHHLPLYHHRSNASPALDASNQSRPGQLAVWTDQVSRNAEQPQEINR